MDLQTAVDGEHHTSRILDGAQVVVLVVDRRDRVVEAFGRVRDLTGRSAAAIVDLPVAEILALCRGGPVSGGAEAGERDVEVRWIGGVDGETRMAVVAIDFTRHAEADAEARARLRQAELMFRQVPGATWTTDRNLRITQFIGQVESRLGVPHDRIVGMSVREFARRPSSEDPAVCAHLRALRGEPSSLRYVLRGRWYQVHVEPLHDEAGAIVGCIAAAMDVTGTREAERRAQTKEAELLAAQQRTISLLEATIESTADGILVVDFDSKIVAYNRRFAALWRIPPELLSRGSDDELLAFAIAQVADPEDFLRDVRGLYRRPAAESLDVIRFRDGRIFERYSRPQDVDGRIVGRVWSFRDVTERERVLRHALLLSDASRMVATLDAEKALDGVAHLLVPSLGDGCTIDVFAESTVKRAVSVGEVDAIGAPAETTAQVRAGVSSTERQADTVRVSVPMTALGRSLGAITLVSTSRTEYAPAEIEVLEEIGRRCAIVVENSRLYRAAQEQLRAREEFVAVASHEIRGPIASIRLAVQALRDGLAPAGKLVDVIDREERRLARLVDELLDLGQLSSGPLPLLLEAVDLADVVGAVATRLAGDLEKSGSALTVHGDKSIVGVWDRLRIEQVVGNLLVNAIKFGLGKPIDVRLGVSDGRAEIEVSDHGIGIPTRMQQTIFDPFERAVPERHYGGLGLGLYIVHAIVVALGGTISVKSAPGEGSSFTVTLPLEEGR